MGAVGAMKVYEKDLKLSKNQNAKRPGVEIDLEKLLTYLKKKTLSNHQTLRQVSQGLKSHAKPF